MYNVKIIIMREKLFFRKSHFLPKFVILLLLWTVASQSFSQISVNVKNKPFRQTLKEIERVSDYRFFYNESLKALDNNITIQVTNASIDDVMLKLLNGTNVTYEENDNIIVLVEKPSTTQQSEQTQQERITIRGKVSDINGEPIIGANIFVPETTIGTVLIFR